MRIEINQEERIELTATATGAVTIDYYERYTDWELVGSYVLTVADMVNLTTNLAELIDRQRLTDLEALAQPLAVPQESLADFE